jgi:hypothetical protein
MLILQTASAHAAYRPVQFSRVATALVQGDKSISAVMVFPFRWYRESRCIDYLSSRVLATATACLEWGESWVCTSSVSTEELRSVSRYLRSGHRSLLPLCIALMKRKISILAACVEHCIDCTWLRTEHLATLPAAAYSSFSTAAQTQAN